MSFPINAVKVDFNQEIRYGYDQANLTYPTVFPTVTFPLVQSDELLALLDGGE